MLDWPEEGILSGDDTPEWGHAGSNLLLDFHGDPLAARLVVFSDGNHNMALLEALRSFQGQNPGVGHIFYATTPPGPLVRLLRRGRLRIGSLILSIRPHVFIGPPNVLNGLVEEGYMQRHMPFMRNRGNVLLVEKGNPRNIRGVRDLARDGIRLFFSNPETERISYSGYIDTIRGIASREGVDLEVLLEGKGVVYGESIHHREAPQAVADGSADAAVVYYHLALHYTRVFPQLFEIVPLGGSAEDPRPVPENVISRTNVGRIGDGGEWGGRLIGFLASDTVSDIYYRHGLLRER
jgi:hypothetical protein